jgi:hypothetical protein
MHIASRAVMMELLFGDLQVPRALIARCMLLYSLVNSFCHLSDGQRIGWCRLAESGASSPHFLATMSEQNPRPSLLTIPVELFCDIAELLNRHNLPALRLVCRDTCQKLHKIFAKTIGKKCDVLLSNKDSLRRFLDIAKDLDYAANIRELNFFVDEIPNPEQYESPRFSARRYARGPEEEEQHRQAWHQMLRLQKLKRDQDLLLNAFCRLRLARQTLPNQETLEIGLMNIGFAYGDTCQLPKELGLFCTKIGARLCVPTETEHHMLVLFSSLALADLSPSELKMAFTNGGPSINTLLDDSWLQFSLKNVFSQLETLDLEICCDRDMEQTKLDKLAAAFAASPRLKTLRLDTGDYAWDEQTPATLRLATSMARMTFPALEYLHVLGFVV